MPPAYFTRLPVTSAAASATAAASAASSSAAGLSSVPSELQAALSALLSLHSQLDSALLRLDSCTSLAALSGASLEVKQRIAQLQQRIAAVQAEVEQRQSSQQPHSRSTNRATSRTSHRALQPLDEDSVVAATSTAPSQSSSAASAVSGGSAGSGVAGASSLPTSGDGSSAAGPVASYDSVLRLLAHHSALAHSYSNTLRQRLLACRAQLAARSKAVRSELFVSSANGLSAAAALPLPLPLAATATAAADRQRQFTASLHHTHSLLQSSLSMSAASLASLSSSTDSLRSTQRHSAVYSEAVKSGGKIITKQQQRQRTDRLLVWCGLAFFLLVCAYITNRRLRISRIIAFLTRTLVPDIHWQQHSSSASQQQPHDPPLAWSDLQPAAAGEL